MKKTLMLLGLSLGLVISSASADDLKNSLSNMLNTKETSGMVDLGNLNLDAKPVKKKVRTGKTVIATINGHKIIKKEADNHLNQRTHGKVTDFDRLAPEQRLRLIQELALPLLVQESAKKELSEEEKEAVYTRAWMQKEARTMKITDEEALSVYKQIQQQAQENNATGDIPSFEKIKEQLKMQIMEKSIVEKLMKNAEIKVL